MRPLKKASDMSALELARYLDHSVLNPEFTQDEIKKHVQVGIDYKCMTVCVNPTSLDLASSMCVGTETMLCVVCDFPFGASTTSSKQRYPSTCR